MADLHTAGIVLVVAAVTVLLRFLPFWLFGGRRNPPAAVSYLGTLLPFSIMGMLVVFCLKSVSILQPPHGLPEAICCLLVVLLHLWKRNALLSIVSGTLCYMLLVQLVFASAI